MYIVEYTDGSTALITDLHGVGVSASHQTALEHLAPGSAYTVSSGNDDRLTFTRLPDIILLARGGQDHCLGTVIQSLLGVYKNHGGPHFIDRTDLRYISVLE